MVFLVGNPIKVLEILLKFPLQIDYLVNGVGLSQFAEFVSTELAVDRALMDLNVLNTVSLTKAVLPGMIECREGCVVMINSLAGKIG